MPSKKRKYNARFPAGRIKKIMQSDEEVGKVAQAVPIIISRTLELFVESMLTKTLRITNARNAKTLSPSHMKQCIMSESRFDFLRELVKNIPDINTAEEQMQADSPEDYSTYPRTSDPTTSTSSNGIVLRDRTTVVGIKRPGTSTEASSTYAWKYNKQHSLDSIAHKLPSASIPTTSNDVPVLNFSIKFDGGNTPKLQRVDSVPLPVTSSTITSASTPIINFDFTKVSFPGTSSSNDKPQDLTKSSTKNNINISTSSSTSNAPPPPQLPASTSSNGLSDHSVATLLQKSSRKTSTIEPPKNNAVSFKRLPSTTSKTSTSATPSSDVTPIININMNTTSIAPIVSYSLPSTTTTPTTTNNSNSLELDEDYDDI